MGRGATRGVPIAADGSSSSGPCAPGGALGTSCRGPRFLTRLYADERCGPRPTVVRQRFANGLFDKPRGHRNGGSVRPAFYWSMV